MGFGRRHTINLCLCFFLALAIISCHARPSFFPFSGNDSAVAWTEGRSLAASVDDYSDPSANHGHDPRNRGGGGGGGKKNP